MTKEIVLIGLVFLSIACSNGNDKQNASQMIRLEKEIDSLNSVIKSALIKSDTSINLQPLESRLNIITKEYEELLTTTSWYKGRELPYEAILVGLEKVYNINDFDTWASNSKDYKSTTQILLFNKWNMEDVTKIKNIIMTTYPFEPQISTNRQGDIDELIWTGAKFDVEIYESGSGNIGMYFLIK